ncbi:acyl-CoA thioesterase [bacterium]|nr:acyl-CoA thioesterase [bacterium]
MELISTHFCKYANVGYHGNLFGGTMLGWLDEAGAIFACEACDTPRMVTKKISEVVFNKPVRPGQIIKIYGEVLGVGHRSIIIRLEARRHSVYNGSQKTVLTTDMTFVRIDGDGEAIPISEKVKEKYGKAKPDIQLSEKDDEKLYEVFGGD